MSRFKGALRSRLQEEQAQSNDYHKVLQLEVVKGLLQDAEKSRDWYKSRADLLQRKVDVQETEIDSLKKKCREYSQEIQLFKTRQQRVEPTKCARDLNTVRLKLEESIRVEEEKLYKIRQENSCLRSIIERQEAAIHDKLPIKGSRQDGQDGYPCGD